MTINSAATIGNVVINEILTQNLSLSTKVNPFVDEDGSYSPWIELFNRGATSVNLAGWSLSNDATNPGQWFFPSGPQSIIAAGGYLVLWADGKDRKNPTGNNKMHTNFSLKQSGEYLGLFSAELPRAVPTPDAQFSPSYPVQRGDVSYGYDTSNALKYFSTPTPGPAPGHNGASNGTSSISGITSNVNFSVNHGYFSGPFNLVLSCPTAGATIRYTTDGSVPTASNGTVYSTPINISATTALRAAAFGPNMLSSDVSTQTYLFVSSVLTQPANPPGYPTQFGSNPVNNTWTQSPANVVNGSQCYFQVDPTIAANDASFIKAGLLQNPALEITLPIPNMFDQTIGLYDHPLNSGPGWESGCSLEMIYPDGSQGDFQIDCGVQIQGGSSRDPVKNFKHSFRITFKDDYGSGSLQQTLLPGTPVNDYNTFDIDGGSNDTWDYVGASGASNQRQFAQQTHDAFTSDLYNAMGWPSFHSQFVNVYINGLYWGLDYIHERPDASFAATYFGGDKSEYDVIRNTTSGNEVESNSTGFQSAGIDARWCAGARRAVQ